MRLSDVEYAAVHESGHLVAALALGLDPAGSAISPDGKLGVTIVDTDTGSMADAAMVALAGYAATTIAGDTSPVEDRDADGDIALAQGFLACLSAEEAAEVGPMTVDLIKSRWALVVLVADLLAANGEVCRDDIAEADVE